MAEQDQSSFINEKLYSSIEKLADVSSNLSKLVATHGVRLDYIEKTGESIQKTLNQQDEKYDSDHKESTKMLEDLKSTIDVNHVNVNNDIQTIKGQVSQNIAKITNLEKRTNKLETKMWLIIGGATTAGVIFSRVVEFGITYLNLHL